MPLQKVQKIDINASYPCPCCRRGYIRPISLTEALGCDRCQQIFVVGEHGQTIEKVSTNYPYQRSWCWTGTRWIIKRSSPYQMGRGNFTFYLLLVTLAVIILLLLAALI